MTTIQRTDPKTRTTAAESVDAEQSPAPATLRSATPTDATPAGPSKVITSEAARGRATSAEQLMRLKVDTKADDVAQLKEHHPLAMGDDSPEVQGEVKQLQAFLKEKGLFTGEPTGKFDAATDKAVRAFQKQSGLKVDGIVGQQTWGAVLGVKVEPGLKLLKPWAHSFTHASGAGAVHDAPSATSLRARALALHGQPFLDKLDVVAQRLGTNPDSLLKVMNNESGLKTDAVNPRGGATGLIQFMPATARGLGTTTEALKGMSAVQQLDYVEKYYAPFKGKLGNAADLYMATFYPAALGKPGDYVIGGSNAGLIARENPIFDIDGDGTITAQNFRDYCKRRFGE